MKTEQAYSEILELLKKHKDLIAFDIDDLERKAEHHLFGLKLKEEYGFNIDPKSINSLDYVNVGHYRSVSWYGQKYSRTISWSDSGKQPVDELLLCISFPTGAYIFGNDYPKDLFQKFFNKLKTYNPKYIDTHNGSLFFSMSNAGKVYNDFDSILNKYIELNNIDLVQRRIKKMKQELKMLEDLNK